MGRKFIRIFFLMSVPVFVAMAVGVIFLHYQATCYFILRSVGKTDKLKEFQSDFLTTNKFSFLKIILCSLFLFFASASFFLSRRAASILNFLLFVSKQLKETSAGILSYYKHLDRQTKLLLSALSLVSFGVSLFYALSVPVDIDEAWTYLNFSRNSILVSCSYYPAPNNHIFYSLLTNLTYCLPFSPLMNMRIINIAISLLVLLIFFKLANKIFSSFLALFTTALFHFTYLNLLYSFQARGYELLLFFSLISFYSVLALTETGRRKYLFIYCISSVMGFYTMPTYLYFFLSLNIFLSIFWLRERKYRQFVSLIICNTISALAIILLYLPVILVSRSHALFNNTFIKPIGRLFVLRHLPDHFNSVVNEMIGIMENSYSLIILFFLLGFLIFYSIRDDKNSFTKRTRELSSYMLGLPPVFLILQSVIPYARTWIYITVPFFLAIGFVMDRLNFKRRNFYAIAAIQLAIVFLLILNFNKFNRNEFSYDYIFDRAVAHIDFKGKKSISSDNINYGDLLTYKVSIANKNKLPVTVVFDTLSPMFLESDIVLLTANKRLTGHANYQLTFDSENIRIYSKKQ